jgi:ELWxxDGT repeat protein
MSTQIALFNGLDTSGRNNLWVTDGTAAGTYEITGIIGADSQYGLNPGGMTVFNGEVLFAGQDASGGVGLWTTDGTAAGTHEITPSANLSLDAVVFNGKLLFTGWDTLQNNLWVTDGTAAGTYEITGIIGANSQPGFGLSPERMTVFNNEVLSLVPMQIATLTCGLQTGLQRVRTS